MKTPLEYMKEGETLRTAGSWTLFSELAYSHCSLTGMVVWHTSTDQTICIANCPT